MSDTPKKYRVQFYTGAYAYVTVEAETEEEAIEEAHQHTPSICAQCSGWGQYGVALEVGDDWELSDSEHAIEQVDDDAEVANG